MSRAPLLLLASLSLAFLACDAPPEPKPTTAPAQPVSATPAAADAVVVEAEPASPATSPSSKPAPEGWQRGTVTVFPDGIYGVHADDDSITVCGPDLPVELQKPDLPVLFRGDVEPPIPRDRRWCRISRNLEVKLAE